jgi:hypothetical protein
MNHKVTRLSRLETQDLNAYRRRVMDVMAEMKQVERNLKLLVNQNTLDKTPTLLTGQDTGDLERRHAAEAILHSLGRVREVIETLPS